jgi:peptide/nickel transport system permease protein
MIGVITVVFTITYFTPGDPVANILGVEYTQADYDAKAAELGLDKPFLVQLGTYIWKLFTRFDLGKSYLTNFKVGESLSARIPITVSLSLLGIVLMIIVGLPLGILSALKQYSGIDITLTSLSLIMAAIPNFVLALLCLLLFGVTLRWLPITGLASWKSWILPVFSHSGGGIALYTRMTRTTMLEVIRQDYIRTARAKGQKEGVIVRKHALKNCMIPLATITGTQIAHIFAGSVIVETIFAIPGMGTYLLSGIHGRDYPIVIGCVVVVSLLVCIVNLLVDIAYGFIDPRIRGQFFSSRKKKAQPAVAEAASASAGKEE